MGACASIHVCAHAHFGCAHVDVHACECSCMACAQRCTGASEAHKHALRSWFALAFMFKGAHSRRAPTTPFLTSPPDSQVRAGQPHPYWKTESKQKTSIGSRQQKSKQSAQGTRESPRERETCCCQAELVVYNRLPCRKEDMNYSCGHSSDSH